MTNQKSGIKYEHPIIFYALSTIIPWTFWIIAGQLSHKPNINMTLISVLGFTGLLVPMIIAFWLIHKETGLKRDLGSRIL